MRPEADTTPVSRTCCCSRSPRRCCTCSSPTATATSGTSSTSSPAGSGSTGATWTSRPSSPWPAGSPPRSSASQAGALDWLGRAKGLPPARSGHNHYFRWGPGEEPEHLLVVDGEAEELQPLCQRTELLGRVPPNPYVMPYEDNLPLYLCSGLKVPLATLWPSLKHYE